MYSVVHLCNIEGRGKGGKSRVPGTMEKGFFLGRFCQRSVYKSRHARPAFSGGEKAKNPLNNGPRGGVKFRVRPMNAAAAFSA